MEASSEFVSILRGSPCGLAPHDDGEFVSRIARQRARRHRGDRQKARQADHLENNILKVRFKRLTGYREKDFRFGT